MHYPSGENGITKKEIFDMAEKYGVQIRGYAEDSAADLVISYNTTDYTEDGSYVAVDLDDAKTALFLAEETWQRGRGGVRDLQNGDHAGI